VSVKPLSHISCCPLCVDDTIEEHFVY
jgi:hypothetical protein